MEHPQKGMNVPSLAGYVGSLSYDQVAAWSKNIDITLLLFCIHISSLDILGLNSRALARNQSLKENTQLSY